MNRMRGDGHWEERAGCFGSSARRRFAAALAAVGLLANACANVKIEADHLSSISAGSPAAVSAEGPNPDAIYHVLLFHLAFAERNNAEAFPKALAEIEKAVEMDPDSPFLRTTLAMLYLADARGHPNRVQDALAQVTGVLADNPGYLPARRLQARLSGQNEPDKAIEAYQKVLEGDPDDEEATYGLVGLWTHAKEYDKAVKLLEEHLARNPDSYQALRTLAEIAMVRKDSEGVERYYGRLVELNPNSVQVLGDLGRYYEEEGKTDRAIETYRKILTLHHPSPAFTSSLRRRLARLLIQQGKLEEAVSELQEIEKSEGGRSDARVLLGLIYLDQKRYDEAIDHFTKILEHEPGQTSIAYYLGIAYADSGKNAAAAIEQLKKIPPASKDFIDATVRLALLLADEKRFDEAVAATQAAMAENERQVREGGSAPDDGTGREVEPGADSGEDGEGESEGESEGEDEGALEEEGESGSAEAAGEGESMPPNVPPGSHLVQEKVRLYRVLAFVHEKAAKLDLAIDALRQALSLNPEDGKLHFDLGVTLDKAGRGPECVAEMKKVIQLNPEDASALNYLGYTWAEKGERLDEAEDMIKRALAVEPEDGYFVDSLGWVYYKKGRMTDAVAELERAVKIVPDDPVINEHLGDAYLAVGEKGKALELFQKALDLHAKGGKEETARPDDAQRQEDLKKKIEGLGGPTPAKEPPSPPASSSSSPSSPAPAEGREP